MMIATLESTPDGGIVDVGGMFTGSTTVLIADKLLNHFNVLQLPDARATARWVNTVQEMAASTRLGIPVTLYTDPRHSFSENFGVSLAAGRFSHWPEGIGFGAIDDPALTEQFADIARQEYLAVGIRGALHPQVDLVTEPRWPRAAHGFSESAHTTERLWSPPTCAGFKANSSDPRAWRV